MNLDGETIAKSALEVAAAVVGQLNPLAGTVVTWASKVAFEIYDQQKQGSDPIAAAQLAGDRVADLIEDLKFGSKS